MARRTKSTGSLKSWMPYFYNISNTVEFNDGHNSAEDVALVQFLIREIHQLEGFPGKPPAVTGVMDEFTGFWIYMIQQRMSPNKSNAIVDGRVSPAQSDGAHSKGWFLITSLNYALYKRVPEKFAAYPDNPSLPASARSQLKAAA